MRVQQNLISLKESTKNDKTKRVVEGLISVIELGEITENNVAKFVTESLNKLRSEDTEVDKFMNYMDNKKAVSSFGLKGVLESIKNTAVYGTNSDLKGLVEVFEESLSSHSEVLLVDNFLKNAEQFRWNTKVDEAIRPMESKIEKYKTFKLLEEAILEMKNGADADIYEDDIRRLENAFYLPENHVRSYIYSTFQNQRDCHPAVANVLEKMYKIDQSIASNITYFTNRTQGRVSAYERVSPFMVKEGKEYFMMNGSIYENDKGSVKKVTDFTNMDENFIKLCEAFSMFESDAEGMTITDGDTEYRVKESDENEDGYTIEVDGEEQVEETNREVFENLSTMGTQSNMIHLLKYIGENLAQGNIALMDNILTLIPDGGRATIDLIKAGDTGILFINICDNEVSHEQLFPAADANIDAITTDVQNNYGVDLAPFVEKLTGVNEGLDAEGDPADAEAQAKAEEAEAELAKEKELTDLKDELEEVETNMDKIEVLDEEYKEEEDIKQLYDELTAKKDNIKERIMELEAELSDKPVEGDEMTVAEKIFAEIEDIRASKSYESELENSEDGYAHEMGSPQNVTDDMTVTPIVEFEKDENGEAKVSSVLLHVDDKSVDESEELADKVKSKMRGSDYEVLEENYINLMHTPTSAEDQLPQSLTDTISDVVEKLLNDTVTEEEEEDAEGDSTNEGIGDRLKKFGSQLKSGFKKLGQGDNTMVSEDDDEDDEDEEDEDEEGEDKKVVTDTTDDSADVLSGGDPAQDDPNAKPNVSECGLMPHMKVIFPSFHRNSRLAGRSGYIVAVDEENGTAVVDFDENDHDPMEYQPNIPIADIDGYTNEMDTVESSTKSMTTRELVDGIKKAESFMGESDQSDAYLTQIKSTLEKELTDRGKGHLLEPAE